MAKMDGIVTFLLADLLEEGEGDGDTGQGGGCGGSGGEIILRSNRTRRTIPSSIAPALATTLVLCAVPLGYIADVVLHLGLTPVS